MSILDELFAEATPYEGKELVLSYNNPSWIRLGLNDIMDCYGDDNKKINKREAKEIFENFSEEDLESVENKLYFRKSFYDDKDIKIYEGKDEDLLYTKLGSKNYIFSVYQIGSIYRRKNIITITGWDYNTVIDLDDKKIETEDIR